MDEDIGTSVELYVYDLTKGAARFMSQMILGKNAVSLHVMASL